MSETWVLVSASRPSRRIAAASEPASRTSSAASWRRPSHVTARYRGGRTVAVRSHPASNQGVPMADKSPRQGMSKKSGKSIKEKRAEKHAKAVGRHHRRRGPRCPQEEVSLLQPRRRRHLFQGERAPPPAPPRAPRPPRPRPRPADHPRARVRRTLRPHRRGAGAARGRLRVPRGDHHRLRRGGAAQAAARGRGRHARRPGPLGLAALRPGPGDDPAGDRPGADADRLRGDEPLDRGRSRRPARLPQEQRAGRLLLGAAGDGARRHHRRLRTPAQRRRDRLRRHRTRRRDGPQGPRGRRRRRADHPWRGGGRARRSTRCGSASSTTTRDDPA